MTKNIRYENRVVDLAILESVSFYALNNDEGGERESFFLLKGERES